MNNINESVKVITSREREKKKHSVRIENERYQYRAVGIRNGWKVDRNTTNVCESDSDLNPKYVIYYCVKCALKTGNYIKKGKKYVDVKAT